MNATVFNFQANTEFEYVVKNLFGPNGEKLGLFEAAMLWGKWAKKLNDEHGTLFVNAMVSEVMSSFIRDEQLCCNSALSFRGLAIYQNADSIRHWKESVSATCYNVGKELNEGCNYGGITFRECDHGRT